MLAVRSTALVQRSAALVQCLAVPAFAQQALRGLQRAQMPARARREPRAAVDWLRAVQGEGVGVRRQAALAAAPRAERQLARGHALTN